MTEKYLNRLERVVNINQLYNLKQEEIWDILDTSKAIILDGHFELLSGKHSDAFFRFANINQFPHFVAEISNEMVSWLLKGSAIDKIDVVLGPASQGIFLAYDIARELSQRESTKGWKIRTAYTPIDRDTGRPKRELIEDFEIGPNKRVLIVNDLATTGSGLEILVELVQKICLAKVVGICIFANRGIDEPKVQNLQNRFRFHSIIDLDLPSWPSEDCQSRCNAGRRIIKSRDINHLPIFADENAYELYAGRVVNA